MAIQNPVTLMVVDANGNPVALGSTNDGAHVLPKDALGNTMPNNFVPSVVGGDLTGSAANQTQSLTSGTTAIRFSVATADAKIKFGDAATPPDATIAGAMQIQAGVVGLIVNIPPGADRFAFTGNTSAINWVEQ